MVERLLGSNCGNEFVVGVGDLGDGVGVVDEDVRLP